MTDKPIRWKAPEHKPSPKGSDWYWALGIIAVAGATTAVILGNLLFAILILIGAFTLALYRAREPQEVTFELNRAGLVMGTRLLPYSSLASFWIAGDEDGYRLLLKSDRMVMPQITIPIPYEILQDVQLTLSQHLPEEEQDEPIAERILEFFGF